MFLRFPPSANATPSPKVGEKPLHHDFTHRHHDPAHLVLGARRRLEGLEAVKHSGGILVSVLAQGFVNVAEADGAVLRRVPEHGLRLLQ